MSPTLPAEREALKFSAVSAQSIILAQFVVSNEVGKTRAGTSNYTTITALRLCTDNVLFHGSLAYTIRQYVAVRVSRRIPSKRVDTVNQSCRKVREEATQKHRDVMQRKRDKKRAWKKEAELAEQKNVSLVQEHAERLNIVNMDHSDEVQEIRVDVERLTASMKTEAVAHAAQVASLIAEHVLDMKQSASAALSSAAAHARDLAALRDENDVTIRKMQQRAHQDAAASTDIQKTTAFQNLDVSKKLRQAEASSKTSDEALANTRKELAEINQAHSSVKKEVSSLNHKLLQLNPSLAQAESNLEKSRKQLEELLTKTVPELHRRLETANGKVAALEPALNDAKVSSNKYQHESQECQGQFMGLKVEFDALKKQTERQAHERPKLEAEISRLEKQLLPLVML